MLIVSMFTPNTPYEKELDRLTKSLDVLEIEYVATPIHQMHDWAFNCGQNARTIYENMVKFNDDILYLDADAEMKSTPVIFDNICCDIAIHRIKYPEREELEYCTGTLFCRNNQKVKEFLNLWAKMNNVHSDDQINFRTLYESSDIDLYDLPQEYCFIIGNRIHKKKIGCKPVIVHHQASRKWKNNIYGRNY